VLHASLRPVPYYNASNPRNLLHELSLGPQPCDSLPELRPVMESAPITDTTILGFSLSDSTLLVNFAPGFSDVVKSLYTPESERLLAYSLTNTLCMDERIKSVCFFQSGSQFETFTGEIYWSGLFYPLVQ